MPQARLALSIAPSEELWVLISVPPLDVGGAALTVAEVSASDHGAEPSVRLEWRASDGRVLAVGASGTRYARSFTALGASDGAAQTPAAEDGWQCRGPCVATRAVSGDTYLRIENAGDEERTLQLWAYARRPSDPNEPNDTIGTATSVTLQRDGDGTRGAIEFPGDLDHVRLVCAPGFAGPSDGVRVRLTSESELAPMLQLTAGGARYGVGQESQVLPCGAVVTVATRDGSAGPGAHSHYTLSARAAPLYVIDAPAQPFPTTPTPVGRLTLGPRETLQARLWFGASAATLRFVEVVGVGGTAADGAVVLDVTWSSGLTAASDDRRRFAASVGALGALVTPVARVDPASVTVVNACFGPCVAERYRTGEVVARITNTTSQTRTVDLYAYGAKESDRNEPNDSASTATGVSVPVGGTVVSGAIERIGDRDAFALTCSAQREGVPLTVALESSFPGALRVRPWSGGVSARPGGSITVACGATVLVETADGSAGPSDASLYLLRVE